MSSLIHELQERVTELEAEQRAALLAASAEQQAAHVRLLFDSSATAILSISFSGNLMSVSLKYQPKGTLSSPTGNSALRPTTNTPPTLTNSRFHFHRSAIHYALDAISISVKSMYYMFIRNDFQLALTESKEECARLNTDLLTLRSESDLRLQTVAHLNDEIAALKVRSH